MSNKWLDYDDVSLVPCPSSVISRDDVDLKSLFRQKYPIFSSPMKNISGKNLLLALHKNNCVGILHRFMGMDQRIDDVLYLSSKGVEFGVAIGTKTGELEFAEYAASKGVALICVDVANGYTNHIVQYVKELSKRLPSTPIMAGNVCTGIGALNIAKAGAKFNRVGIGTGSLCTTRDQTGIYVPMLSALWECKKTLAHMDTKVFLVADGGIKNSGNAAKAFAFGADFVLLGSLVAYAEEADNEDGTIYGMASGKLQDEYNGFRKSVEGKVIQRDETKIRPLKDILDEFLWNVASACAYTNSGSYKQLMSAKYIYT